METQIRGTLSISHLDSDAPFFIEKIYGLPTQSEEQLLDMLTGDLDDEYTYHHAPVGVIQPVLIEGESPILILDFQDQLEKSYPLANAYQVTAMIGYVEAHPEIEKIADPVQRKELYERAIRAAISGFAG